VENLTKLANKYGSDKGTSIGNPPHGYTILYDLLFYSLRQFDINLLEIGLAIGGPELGGPVERTVPSPSVEMWLDYFSAGNIFGFDICDFSHIKNARFKFVRGDCGSEADLAKLVDGTQSYDIIIDDGSHASFHQQLAFRVLFPHLRPGGVYVIEDLHWQSPFYEDALPRVPKSADFFKHYLESNIYIENSLISREFMRQAREEMHSFALFPDFVHGGKPKLLVMRRSSQAR
jgi:SAM-dependent methyltransferase